MENKLLTIGSITAVVVLVLAGLSPVVGFDSVRSSKMDSPLFTIMRKRGIGEKQELFCNYLGKGKQLDVIFLKRGKTNVFSQMIFNKIRDMHDEEIVTALNTFKKYLPDKQREYGSYLSYVVNRVRYVTDKSYEIDETTFLMDIISETRINDNTEYTSFINNILNILGLIFFGIWILIICGFDNPPTATFGCTSIECVTFKSDDSCLEKVKYAYEQ